MKIVAIVLLVRDAGVCLNCGPIFLILPRHLLESRMKCTLVGSVLLGSFELL